MLDHSLCLAITNGYAVLLAKIGFEQKLLQLPRRASIPLNVIKTVTFDATCAFNQNQTYGEQIRVSKLLLRPSITSRLLHAASNVSHKPHT